MNSALLHGHRNQEPPTRPAALLQAPDAALTASKSYARSAAVHGPSHEQEWRHPPQEDMSRSGRYLDTTQSNTINASSLRASHPPSSAASTSAYANRTSRSYPAAAQHAVASQQAGLSTLGVAVGTRTSAAAPQPGFGFSPSDLMQHVVAAQEALALAGISSDADNDTTVQDAGKMGSSRHTGLSSSISTQGPSSTSSASGASAGASMDATAASGWKQSAGSRSSLDMYGAAQPAVANAGSTSEAVRSSFGEVPSRTPYHSATYTATRTSAGHGVVSEALDGAASKPGADSLKAWQSRASSYAQFAPSAATAAAADAYPSAGGMLGDTAGRAVGSATKATPSEPSGSKATAAATPGYTSTSELISSLVSRYTEAQNFLSDLRKK